MSLRIPFDLIPDGTEPSLILAMSAESCPVTVAYLSRTYRHITGDVSSVLVQDVVDRMRDLLLRALKAGSSHLRQHVRASCCLSRMLKHTVANLDRYGLGADAHALRVFSPSMSWTSMSDLAHLLLALRDSALVYKVEGDLSHKEQTRKMKREKFEHLYRLLTLCLKASVELRRSYRRYEVSLSKVGKLCADMYEECSSTADQRLSLPAYLMSLTEGEPLERVWLEKNYPESLSGGGVASPRIR